MHSRQLLGQLPDCAAAAHLTSGRGSETPRICQSLGQGRVLCEEQERASAAGTLLNQGP